MTSTHTVENLDFTVKLIGPSPVKGTILVNNGTEYENLSVGANEEIIIADSAQPSGIKWDVAPRTGIPSYFSTGFVTPATAGLGTDLNTTVQVSDIFTDNVGTLVGDYSKASGQMQITSDVAADILITANVNIIGLGYSFEVWIGINGTAIEGGLWTSCVTDAFGCTNFAITGIATTAIGDTINLYTKRTSGPAGSVGITYNSTVYTGITERNL